MDGGSENKSPTFAIKAAPEGYENFDKRKDGWTKVVLKPGR